MPLSVFCVAHLRTLTDGGEAEARRGAPPGVGGYSGVFYFRNTWVSAAGRTRRAGLSHTTVPHRPHPFKLRPRRSGPACVLGALSCSQNFWNNFRGERDKTRCWRTQ